MIKRYSKPNEHDQLPVGTICCVEDTNSGTSYYIQNSQDSDHPKWEEIDQQNVPDENAKNRA